MRRDVTNRPDSITPSVVPAGADPCVLSGVLRIPACQTALPKRIRPVAGGDAIVGEMISRSQ